MRAVRLILPADSAHAAPEETVSCGAVTLREEEDVLGRAFKEPVIAERGTGVVCTRNASESVYVRARSCRAERAHNP